MALAFALTLAAAPARAQSLVLVSSTIGLPGNALVTDPNGDNFPDGVVFFQPDSKNHVNQNSAGSARLNFTSVVANNQLPTAIGDVGSLLVGLPEPQHAEPPSSGGAGQYSYRPTRVGTQWHRWQQRSPPPLTGIFLNGFASSQIDTESFQLRHHGPEAQGAAILNFLNQSGGVITASIDDLNTSLNQTDGFVGGTMTLAFSVPFFAGAVARDRGDPAHGGRPDRLASGSLAGWPLRPALAT